MKELKIFEIPIYSKTKEKFDKKWEDYIYSYVKKTTEDNKEDLKNSLNNLYCYNKIWKYNQIIGYIVISIKNSAIWFDEYATDDKKIHFNGGKKHYIHYLNLIGYHFYVDKNKADKEIKEEINKWLFSIEKNILFKSWYLDRSLFDNMIKYINIRNIIDDIKKE